MLFNPVKKRETAIIDFLGRVEYSEYLIDWNNANSIL